MPHGPFARIPPQTRVRPEMWNELQVALENAPTMAEAGSGGGLIEATDYGAISSDTAAASANVATILAAAAAAVTAGGTTVQLPAGSIPINSDIAISAGLVGAGRNATRFEATTAAARITFTGPSWGMIGDFTFDGNNLATAGVTIKGGTHKITVRDVYVTAVAGSPFRLYNVQNSRFDSIDISYSKYGLEILDGCGSLVFNALSSNSNEYYQVRIGEDGVEPSGYTESTAIVFIAPIMEFWNGATANTIANVIITGGAGINMYNAVIVNGGVTPLIKMTREGTAQESTISLTNSGLLGDPLQSVGVSMASNTRIFFQGSGFTGLATGISANGTNISINGEPSFNNVATPYAFAGGSGHAESRTVYTNRPVYTTGYAANVDAARYQNPADGGMRLVIKSSGQLVWGPGTGAESATLYLHAWGFIHTDGYLSGGGGLRSGQSAWDSGHLILEPYRLWVDATGKLRIKSSAPASDTDGTVVGTQT